MGAATKELEQYDMGFESIPEVNQAIQCTMKHGSGAEVALKNKRSGIRGSTFNKAVKFDAQNTDYWKVAAAHASSRSVIPSPVSAHTKKPVNWDRDKEIWLNVGYTIAENMTKPVEVMLQGMEEIRMSLNFFIALPLYLIGRRQIQRHLIIWENALLFEL